MRTKSRIAIVGAGNLASALAVALHKTGYEIEVVVGRSGRVSRAKAREIAKEVGARAVTSLPKDMNAAVVWFCVPDSEIVRAARESAARINWKGRVALHASGALTSDELEPLRTQGASVASMHPLMTFVSGSRPSLAGVPFAAEGDGHALRIARGIVADLGGRAYPIRKSQKAAYHAWATFVCPLFMALLATADRVAEAAGVQGKQARQRTIPILLQTLANYASLDPAGAFSGPIVRGDVDTVARHLRVLKRIPPAHDVYRALVMAALHYLPTKNKSALQRVLRSKPA